MENGQTIRKMELDVSEADYYDRIIRKIGEEVAESEKKLIEMMKNAGTEDGIKIKCNTEEKTRNDLSSLKNHIKSENKFLSDYVCQLQELHKFICEISRNQRGNSKNASILDRNTILNRLESIYSQIESELAPFEIEKYKIQYAELLRQRKRLEKELSLLNVFDLSSEHKNDNSSVLDYYMAYEKEGFHIGFDISTVFPSNMCLLEHFVKQKPRVDPSGPHLSSALNRVLEGGRDLLTAHNKAIVDQMRFYDQVKKHLTNSEQTVGKFSNIISRIESISEALQSNNILDSIHLSFDTNDQTSSDVNPLDRIGQDLQEYIDNMSDFPKLLDQNISMANDLLQLDDLDKPGIYPVKIIKESYISPDLSNATKKLSLLIDTAKHPSGKSIDSNNIISHLQISEIETVQGNVPLPPDIEQTQYDQFRFSATKCLGSQSKLLFNDQETKFSLEEPKKEIFKVAQPIDVQERSRRLNLVFSDICSLEQPLDLSGIMPRISSGNPITYTKLDKEQFLNNFDVYMDPDQYSIKSLRQAIGELQSNIAKINYTTDSVKKTYEEEKKIVNDLKKKNENLKSSISTESNIYKHNKDLYEQTAKKCLEISKSINDLERNDYDELIFKEQARILNKQKIYHEEITNIKNQYQSNI